MCSYCNSRLFWIILIKVSSYISGWPLLIVSPIHMTLFHTCKLMRYKCTCTYSTPPHLEVSICYGESELSILTSEFFKTFLFASLRTQQNPIKSYQKTDLNELSLQFFNCCQSFMEISSMLFIFPFALTTHNSWQWTHHSSGFESRNKFLNYTNNRWNVWWPV